LGNNGGGGRFLLGSNAGTGTIGINLTGASTTTFSGPTTGNPFVKGTPQTPYIPNLASGAEGFGLLSGVDATSAQFAGVRAGAPAHAVGAIIREHLGPMPGYDTDFRRLRRVRQPDRGRARRTDAGRRSRGHGHSAHVGAVDRRHRGAVVR
jgi:hypothetical protein